MKNVSQYYAYNTIDVIVVFSQTCQVNLEGQSFFAKGGKPYCKKHSASRQF